MRTCVYKSSILLFSAFLDVIFFRKKPLSLSLSMREKERGYICFRTILVVKLQFIKPILPKQYVKRFYSFAPLLIQSLIICNSGCLVIMILEWSCFHVVLMSVASVS